MAEPVSAAWQPSPRYPDSRVRMIDASFARYRLNAAKVERLATGFRWCEGPVWFGDGRYLLWSDIPNNRIMRWDEETGAASVFRKPSSFANGNTRDRHGRLLTCEHDARRVTRTEYDGTITVIADRFEGKPLPHAGILESMRRCPLLSDAEDAEEHEARRIHVGQLVAPKPLELLERCRMVLRSERQKAQSQNSPKARRTSAPHPRPAGAGTSRTFRTPPPARCTSVAAMMTADRAGDRSRHAGRGHRPVESSSAKSRALVTGTRSTSTP